MGSWRSGPTLSVVPAAVARRMPTGVSGSRHRITAKRPAKGASVTWAPALSGRSCASPTCGSPAELTVTRRTLIPFAVGYASHVASW
jgi:hypothetical protein